MKATLRLKARGMAVRSRFRVGREEAWIEKRPEGNFWCTGFKTSWFECNRMKESDE